MNQTPTTARVKIFISYATPDRRSADRVEERLRQTGLEVFRDTTSILPGQHFDKQIEEALSQYDCMVLLLSNHSMPMRDEVYREWFPFIRSGRKVIPFRLTECEIHSRLEPFIYIDACDDFNEALDKLIATLGAYYPRLPLADGADGVNSDP